MYKKIKGRDAVSIVHVAYSKTSCMISPFLHRDHGVGAIPCMRCYVIVLVTLHLIEMIFLQHDILVRSRPIL